MYDRIRRRMRRRRRRFYFSFGRRLKKNKKSVSTKKKGGFKNEFRYALNVKPEAKRKRLPGFSGRLRLLAKKFKHFYFLKIRNQPLRKILKVKPMLRKNLPRYLKPIYGRFTMQVGIAPRVRIENRIDVMLYRLNIIPNIWEGRRLIRSKLAYIMTPTA